jgi:hypothetical protein
LNRRYGDYDISKFTYRFEGENNREGNLTITYADQPPMTMKVVKEGDQWKLASH